MVYGWGLGQNGRLGNDNEDVVVEPVGLDSFKEATRLGLMNIR